MQIRLVTWNPRTVWASVAAVVTQETWKRSFTHYLLDSGVRVSKCDSYFLEEERGQKRKRELDEEGEEDEDDWESSWS